jgi:hypothetical protein
MRYIVKDSGRLPGWLATLNEHKNLLGRGLVTVTVQVFWRGTQKSSMSL